MIHIRELRQSKKITMRELGDAIGCSESTISLYERGKRQPDMQTLFAIADYFDVTLDILCGRSFPSMPAQSINDSDTSLLDLFHELSPERQMSVMEYMRFQISEQTKKDTSTIIA